MQKKNRQPSRRDWFRLRTATPGSMLTKPSSTIPGSPASDGLTPIEHPPNYDGMDLSQLPPMREATLSAAQIKSLFSDIGTLATDVLLMQRHAGTQRAQAGSGDDDKLPLAQSALLSGTVERIQIRYQWQEMLWIDTIGKTPDGFRLVRIAHTKPQTA